MALTPESEARVYEVQTITDDERQRIMDFLQGAVYCWCKNRKGEEFAMRDLMGGENTKWGDTPLEVLYTRREETHEDPIKEAGKDSGKLLKKVLANDKRLFEIRKEGHVRHYRWIQ